MKSHLLNPLLENKNTNMYSSQSTTKASYSNFSFDEFRWVIQIRRTLEEELDVDAEDPVCIFNAPKALMAWKPECYIPQQIAIGPYHYLQPELNDMERYKVAAAKRIQKQLPNLKFVSLVDQLMKLELRIRACYHKHLDFNGETLAWMMAVDGCFLLEFFHLYSIKDTKVLNAILSMMSHWINYAGRKAAHNDVLRDIVMLENQIPLFIPRKILEINHSSLDAADDLLQSMLMDVCKELCPFKMMQNFPTIKVTDYAHLLDFLYHMFVPNCKQCKTIEAPEDPNAPADNKGEKFWNSSDFKKLFQVTWKLTKKVRVGLIKKALLSRPARVVFRVPWATITRIPILSLLKEPIESFLFPKDKEETESENNSSNSSNNEHKPPLFEEIDIPSVSKLYKSGVRFVATKGDITTISFDTETFTLGLPTISLDVTTEVLLRNLAAYESSNGSGPLVFARYLELMNGIIDTEEDVKLLRKKGILLNHLRSDQEVADLWNWMNKSERLTKVPFLDKVIEDVNKYYNSRWIVKAKKFLKIYVFGSWRFLTLLATILLLFLMSLQAFCSVYTCGDNLHVSTEELND